MLKIFILDFYCLFYDSPFLIDGKMSSNNSALYYQILRGEFMYQSVCLHLFVEMNQYARIWKLNLSLSYTHKVRSGFTLVSLLSLFLLRLYEIFRCSFDFLDPQCPTNEINTLILWHSVISLQVKCVKIYTSRSESQFWVCRHDQCVRRGRAARHWMGQVAFSPKLRLETVAREKMMRWMTCEQMSREGKRSPVYGDHPCIDSLIRKKTVLEHHKDIYNHV